MAAKNEKTKSKTDFEGRMLPNSFETEQAVLGCALIDSEASFLVVGKLEPADFYNETHKHIFEAIQTLVTNSQPVDIITVNDELEKKGLISSVGGMSYITSLSNIVPSAASCNHYIEIVKRDSIIRQVISACTQTIEEAYKGDSSSSIVGVAEKAIYDIAEKGQKGTLERIDVPLEKVIGKFEDIHKDNTIMRGLKTGFYQIDRAINGLQKSDLIIIAARPGIGKTSLAMNIVSNAAIDSKAKCAVFSLEMGKEQLAQRMLCSVADVSMAKALRGELTEQDWVKIWKADKKLKEADIFIDDNAMNTPSQVLSKCRKLKREKGLDLVVIDYIGLMKADKSSDSRQNEVASISRSLKTLAKEIDIPVIALSQLNRSVETRNDGKPGRPTLSDLRESGAIEQDADMVWFIHRDTTKSQQVGEESKDYTAEIIIAKFRNGATGSAYLRWDGSRTSFVNLEKDANEQNLAETYQKNEDMKRSKKKPESSVGEYKSAINEILTETDDDGAYQTFSGDMVDESLDGLIPPTDIAENEINIVESDEISSGEQDLPKIKKDFSNVQIDDELF